MCNYLRILNVLWYSLPMSVVVLMFGLSGHVCDVLALESSVQP